MLTDRDITTTQAPTSGRILLPDGHGLALRLTASGQRTWILRYRLAGGRQGRQRTLTLGDYPEPLTLAKARKRARLALRRVDAGEDPAAEQDAARAIGDTVADLAKDYIAKYAKVHKRSWRDDQRYLDAEVLPAWRARKVRDLTRRDVRVLIEGIADRGAPISANRCLALVRKMLNWAVSKDWIDANPAALIQKPGAEHSRERVLSGAEIRLVWEACAGEAPFLCALMRLRLMTAQRGGELAKLRWADIDGDWMTIPAAVSKNKKAHRVFLTPRAKDLLADLPRIEGCDYVFPGRRGNRPTADVKKAGRRIATRVLAALREDDATVETFDFRGHDLRRTASTQMAEAGISQADIAKVLNHAEGGPKATHLYNRYGYDREKRIALEAWGRVLANILEDTRDSGKVVPIGGRR
jgi:integrase